MFMHLVELNFNLPRALIWPLATLTLFVLKAFTPHDNRRSLWLPETVAEPKAFTAVAIRDIWPI
jgi:hypothetical protein